MLQSQVKGLKTPLERCGDVLEEPAGDCLVSEADSSVPLVKFEVDPKKVEAGFFSINNLTSEDPNPVKATQDVFRQLDGKTISTPTKTGKNETQTKDNFW